MTRWKRLGIGLGIGAFLISAGCNSSGHGASTTPDLRLAESPVRIAGADVLINGQSVDGQSIAPGSGTGALFTATLVDPADASRVRAMYMDYPMHSAMGMMDERGTVHMYDDGTHCDTVAGDGHYCYYDGDGHIGPESPDCPRGDYVYAFHGVDLNGAETNLVDCQVIVH